MQINTDFPFVRTLEPHGLKDKMVSPIQEDTQSLQNEKFVYATGLGGDWEEQMCLSGEVKITNL